MNENQQLPAVRGYSPQQMTNIVLLSTMLVTNQSQFLEFVPLPNKDTNSIFTSGYFTNTTSPKISRVSSYGYFDGTNPVVIGVSVIVIQEPRQLIGL